MDNANIGFNGYELILRTAGDYDLFRDNGGGGGTAIILDTWTPDINTHFAKVTREVSGVNRYWRIYLDNVLIAGPVNSATYNVAAGFGLRMDEDCMVSGLKISF